MLESLSVDRLDLWVTIAFSAKESFYKAAYPTVGRFFDFSAAQVVSVNPGVGRLLLEVVEPLDETFVAGSRWPVDFGVFCDFVVLTAVLKKHGRRQGTNNLQSCDVGAGNHRGIHHVPARSGGPWR